MSLPDRLKYTTDHEWVADGEDGEIIVGITAYAAEALGDVVYVQLPEPGATVTAGEPCGEIESTKSVSDLFAPADGEVTAVNPEIDDAPDLVNSDPFGAGWLFRMRQVRAPQLLDANAYQLLIGEA